MALAEGGPNGFVDPISLLSDGLVSVPGFLSVRPARSGSGVLVMDPNGEGVARDFIAAVSKHRHHEREAEMLAEMLQE